MSIHTFEIDPVRHPVTILKRPTGADYPPLPGNLHRAPTALVRAREICGGDLVLACFEVSAPTTTYADHYTDVFPAAPSTFTGGDHCNHCASAATRLSPEQGVVITRDFPWDVCDVWDRDALALIIPAAWAAAHLATVSQSLAAHGLGTLPSPGGIHLALPDCTTMHLTPIRSGHEQAAPAGWVARHGQTTVYDSTHHDLDPHDDARWAAQATALYAAEVQRGTDFNDIWEACLGKLLKRACTASGLNAFTDGSAGAEFVTLPLPDGSQISIDDSVHETTGVLISEYRRLFVNHFPLEKDSETCEEILLPTTGTFWGDMAALLQTARARHHASLPSTP
ncbi:hypothetical protein [Streptomyces sp. NPDC059003]|uniref:hypothetical protein n=1 Tax=Streptomyces sp. NPDC059003 TaxID=3346691 RepID=UPI003682021C